MTIIAPIYFKAHLRVLFYLGIDVIPVENQKLKVFLYAWTSVVVGALCLFTLTESMDLGLNYEGLDKLTFGLCYLVTHLLGLAKMFLMLALRKKLWHNFQKMETGIFKPNYERGGQEEFDLVAHAIKWCKIQVGYTFYAVVLLILGGRVVYAILTNIRNKGLGGDSAVVTPYTTWMPFDYSNSPNYECVFVFQVASTATFGFYIGATDVLIWGFMMLIKAQFLILKRSLDTLFEKANTQKLANECANHHQELLNFCDDAEDDFCYLMLMQFGSSSLIICFSMFQLSRLTPGTAEFVSMLLYTTLITFQLLLYCWHGNEVALVSGQVASYVYDTDWVDTEHSVKKTLLLIMVRGQRAHFFTAGKISILSLETFMTIMRAAVSYFMFLQQMSS